MSVNAPAVLMDKWPLFVKYGVTKECVYQSMLASSYDGNGVIKPVGSSHNVDVVFDKIGAFKVDGSTILLIDRVAIFPALALPVVPKLHDILVDPSLKEWEVKDVVEDPADAHYELRVRPIT